MAQCRKQHQGARCTLPKIPDLEGAPHYGPGHIDERTHDAWFDDTLPIPKLKLKPPRSTNPKDGSM